MGLITSNLYKLGKAIYKVLPGKKVICTVLKKSGLPLSGLQRDLRFSGPFEVSVDSKHSFSLYHHGGAIENETFWNGLFNTFEPDTGWIWIQLAPVSNVIFDIGANTGLYSLVAKAVNSNAKVYAFEPSLITCKELAQNNKLNDFDIKCEQIALSNLNGKQVFYDTTEPNQTSASLSPEKLKDFGGFEGQINEYEVETMTMSKYITDNGFQQIDLIKIDIEMHEPAAIEGLGKYLAIFKPVVVIEVLTDSVADSLNELIDDNYIRFHLKNENQMVEQTATFKAVPYEYNYIFFHKDKEAFIRKHTTLYGNR